MVKVKSSSFGIAHILKIHLLLQFVDLHFVEVAKEKKQTSANNKCKLTKNAGNLNDCSF